MVVMASLSGKSKLQAQLAKYQGDKPLIPLDADSLAASIVAADASLQAFDTDANVLVLEAMLFPKLEAQMKTILETRKDGIVVCITSNTNFVDWLNIKDKRVSVFLPGADLFAQMLKDINAASGDKSSTTFQKSRDAILVWAQSLEKDAGGVHIYSCLDDIIKVLADKFSLKLSAF